MNENHLLFWLTDLADEYVLEAVERFRAVQHRPRRRLSRLLVIAAAVAAIVAITAVAYGVSVSHHGDKQREQREETVQTPAIVDGVSIEILSSVRARENLQKMHFSLVVDKEELLPAFKEAEPELRCATALVLGGLSGTETDSNRINCALEMVLTETAKPGDTHAVEIWIPHPKRWVPKDDPTAEPVEAPPSTGDWMQQSVCFGILEVTVTSWYSGTADFGDSLPVPLNYGTAYIQSADVMPDQIRWNIALPKAFPLYPYLENPEDTEFPALIEALKQTLRRNALCFADGSCQPLAVGDWAMIGEGGMTASLTCYYHAIEGGLLQKTAAITGVAVGERLYPINQPYDPDGIIPAPDYISPNGSGNPSGSP